jgi:transposase
MPQVNKDSLREEFERCKTEVKKLASARKLSPETEALFNSMLMLMNLLVSIFLEKTTKKTNINSSKPSSQTEQDESTPSQEGSHKKGRKENEELFSNARTKATMEISKVSFCEDCGADISGVAAHEYEERQLTDIIFEKVVHTVRAEIKECPDCGNECKGQFPSNMPGPLQYGIGVIAYVLNLVIAQMVSLERVQKSVKSLIGVVLSQATILNYVQRLYTALAEWEKVSIEQIVQQQVLNTDETSMRVKKKNQWVHVVSGGDITLKFLHPKRGKEAIEDIGVIPRYGGVIIHDCWSSYLSYEHCEHGLCGSHLLRELTFVIESNGYRWAKNMKRLLQETCRTVSKRKRKRLTEKEYQNLQKRYRNILTRGANELPPIPPKSKGKRGRIAKSDAHNLWERLDKHQQAVLLFAQRADVPFTNNRAERDLRMGKVKQKVSGCFRNEDLAKAYCRISSYLQTMAAKGFNPLIAIQIALDGKAARMMG